MKVRNLYFIAICLSLSIYTFAQQKDIFEQFALQKRAEISGQEKNPPLVLPDVLLEWDATVGETFQPSQKITTQVQLEKELSKMRRRYAPFMKDYAPQLPKTRRQCELDEFQWRLLASEMRTDEKGDLYPIPQIEPIEDSEWQTVAIPHYAGPINKAEAIYKKEIHITPALLASDQLYLHFNGVDYMAEIYINGHKVGTHIGLLGSFEMNIKPFVKEGKNSLEIKVFNDSLMMGDNLFVGPDRKFGKKLAACGGPGWNEPGKGKGWNSCPPGFGIWQRCYLEARPSAFINDIYVRPLLDEAKAEVRVEVANIKDQDISLSYSLYGQNFKSELVKDLLISHKGNTKDSLGLTVYQFTIDFTDELLRVWSLDEPWLYQLQVKIKNDQKLVDAGKQQFGMRSFAESVTSTPKGRFYLNGKEIKLRGANMMGNLMQCVMRNDFDQLRDDILLAKIVGMNFWRMTQQPCQPEVYDYFDKLGLLAQTDMPVFNGYRKDAVEEAKPQFIEMMRLIRSHPCNAVISYCNEPDFNKPMMLDRQQHADLFSSFDAVASFLNPGQVTKWIEGDYINISPKHSDHHCYETWYGNSMRTQYMGEWYATSAGWMHTCGEFGAEGLDQLSLMKKYFPGDWLNTEPDGKWEPSRIPGCQTGKIGKKWLNIKTATTEEWIQNSREYQMWATRLFTEALRRNPKMNAIAIHLLIDAWPSSWLKSVMDTERNAKPAYFAYLDALSPIAVNLRPEAFYGFSGQMSKVAVFVCNDTPNEYSDGKLRYQVELDGKILYMGSSDAIVPASNPQFQGYLEFPFPEVSTRKKLTVRVGLFNSADQLQHDSFYELEVFPVIDKGKQLEFPGGYPQRLIQ